MNRSRWHVLSAVVLALAGDVPARAAAAKPAPEGAFVRHGVPAAVSEPRGVVAVGPGEGLGHLIVSLPMDRLGGALRASVLVVDARTGKAGQYFWPDERTANDAPFHLLVSRSTRKLYTTFGGAFVEFDLRERAFTFAAGGNGAAKLAGPAMSLAEAPDGRVYAGVYPTCELAAFDPKARTLRTLVKLDEAEKYPSSMAATGDGWVYVGIGTARRNLVAYHPGTKERRQLLDESRRTTGTVTVRTGPDGSAYARVAEPSEWVRLRDGRAEPVPGEPALVEGAGGMPWQESRARFADGAAVRDFELGDRRMTFVDAAGKAREVAFDYRSEGAAIAAMAGPGPDGRVYGNTSHPMRFFSVGTDGEIERLGGIRRVGGGNFPALVSCRGKVYGVSYSGGDLYEYDPAAPWAPEGPAAAANPRAVGQFRPHLQRPRGGLAHSDGRTVIFGGFPGYGHTGGGLLLYDVEARRQTGLAAANLAPGHSPVALAEMPGGDVLAGTSVLTPGGGHAAATTAEVVVIDWATKRVRSRTPVEGATEIVSLLAGGEDGGGLAFGVTRESTFFVFDPAKGAVVRRTDLRQMGGPAGAGQRTLMRGEDGRVWVALSNGIGVVAGDGVRAVARPAAPITAVGAIAAGRLWFGSGSALWSWRIGEGE